MKRSGLISMLCLGAAIVGMSASNDVFSTGLNVQANSTNWTFTLPVDGDQIEGMVGAVGTGPADSAAMIAQYTQDNVNPKAVYAHELTLVGTHPVTTTNTTFWGRTLPGSLGPSFLTIYPVGNGNGLDDGPPGTASDPTEPIDIANIVFLAGGDSVSYFGLNDFL